MNNSTLDPASEPPANLYAALAAGFPNPADLFAELPDGRFYRYQDVEEVSARFANVLTGMGVKPGDRVAAQTPKSIEALMLYLGAVRAGAVFLPLNTAYQPAEVAYFLKDAEPAVFVAAPDVAETLAPIAAEAGARLETLGVYHATMDAEEAPKPEEVGTLAVAALSAAAEFETVACEADDLAAILYTSGTTGRSKGAMLTHQNLLSNALTLRDYWRFTSSDVLIHALPIFHTHGLFVATNTVLAAQAAMIFQPKFDADAVIDALPRATTMMGVPTFYTRLLSDDRLSQDLVRHIRLFVSGSAPLLAQTHHDFEARTGHRILERYGMTETNMNTSNPYEGDRRGGTVGFPLPGVTLRVVDAQSGAELPQGEIGVIEVKGPNVFQGYWRMPEKTNEEFRDDGFFITGDLGMVDADGYVSIVGRDKDLIISGGFNVYPKEVELAIDALPGVAESAVIGLPHADFGEGVAAVVVPEPGAAVAAADVLSGVGDKLARFKQPKRVFIVDALPRNAMGKVTKAELRKTYADSFNN
ncbi:MAG: malonyl-CoA synthase [Rhodobacteraceae bacterium]|nr:malonyl-CoA synthase [Paracoccaceae bacterium]